MTVLDASQQEGLTPIGDGVNQYITNQMQEYLVDWWPGHVSEISSINSDGTLTFVPTSVFPTFTIIADKEGYTYSNDFYYRIHYTPQIVNLGNILSDQIFNLKVWNAHFITKTLSSISETTLPDITLNSPITIPGIFNGLQELTFPLTVPSAGEAIISGSYTFTWTDSAYTVLVMGTRIVLWPFAPQNEFQERREWKTEILTAIDGSEERHLLRSIPRTYFNYSYSFRTPAEFVLAETLAKNFYHTRIGVPSWQEYTKVFSVQAGSYSIDIDTTNLELFLKQSCILWSSYSDYEVKTIASFTSSTITFTMQINNSKSSCFFIPVKIGHLNSAITFETNDNHERTSSISAFTTQYWNTISFPGETFNSLPVFTEGNITTGGLTDSFQREMSFIDSETGLYETFSKIEYTPAKYTLRIKVFGREEKHRIIKLLNYFKGKKQAFYCPTFQQDLTIVYPDLVSGTLSFLVKTSGWSNSNLYPIRVSGSTDQNLTLDSISANDDRTDLVRLTTVTSVTNNNIFRISKLIKVRLDTDIIEYAYSRSECLTVVVPLIEVK